MSYLEPGSEAEALRLFHDLWSLLTVVLRRFETQVGEGGT